MTATIMSIKEVQEKTVSIFKEYPINKVILFGSYAKDDAGSMCV